MPTKIIRCDCTNEYQDKRYGNQLRVMNLTEKGPVSIKTYRCTVCEALHSKVSSKTAT